MSVRVLIIDDQDDFRRLLALRPAAKLPAGQAQDELRKVSHGRYMEVRATAWPGGNRNVAESRSRDISVPGRPGQGSNGEEAARVSTCANSSFETFSPPATS